MTHLEYDWRPPGNPFLETLASHCTLVRYDERGCGLSDRDVADISFEAMVGDLESVVDALRLERFVLLGMSQGGPVAAAYTVRHPEKVARLILHGTYARGWAKRSRAERESTKRKSP
jgi:pimeloyl-ACP methyl ester carboxylesterase